MTPVCLPLANTGTSGVSLTQVISLVPPNSFPSKQTEYAIFAGNYGEATIDFFGKNYHLLNAPSSHNNYWLWGYDDLTENRVIVLSRSAERRTEVFESVQPVDTIKADYVVSYENNVPVYRCRTLKVPLEALGVRTKYYE